MKPSITRVWVPLFIIGMMLTTITSCTKNPTSHSETAEEALTASALEKGKNNSGETAYTTDSGMGTFAGYNETNCPDYGSYEYTLWAGKTNDAGTVLITNDDENIYVTYQTNETADLGEVHVYVWTSLDDIPDRRPAPGQAPYMAENIHADSYTVTIPMSITCGTIYYISTHAALIADARDDGSQGDASNAGETAYGGGTNAQGGFTSTGGAWWGFVTYMVECYYDVSGTVYEDANNNGDFGDELTFEGITVNLLDASGAVIASATTGSDGSYLFEHVAGGADYTVVVPEGPAGDYLANENADGYFITDLSECQTEVDFGFVPLYDLSGTVYDDANNNFDMDGEAGFGGITVVLTDANGTVIATTTTDADGNYLFENQLPGDYTVSVASGPEGYDATENAGGVSLSLTEDTTGIDFGYYMEVVTYDPCDTNQDGTVDTAEYDACNNGGGDDDDSGDDTHPTGEGTHETAFAFGDISFCGEFGPRWGWRNEVADGQVLEQAIWAGAGQCDTSKGTHVGTALISRTGDTVTVLISIFEEYHMDQAHVYAGVAAYPTGNNGSDTVAPGQYTVVESALDQINSFTATIQVSGGADADVLSVLIHAVVGGF